MFYKLKDKNNEKVQGRLGLLLRGVRAEVMYVIRVNIYNIKDLEAGLSRLSILIKEKKNNLITNVPLKA